MRREQCIAPDGMVKTIDAFVRLGDLAKAAMDSSLLILNALPQGTLLLGVAAAAILAYGVYQLLHARYAEL
jgi:hypothetical protein